MKYFLTLISILVFNLANAQDGTIDSTFGVNGRVLTLMQSSNDKLNFVEVQSDDKILAGGNVIYDTVNNKNAFALIRYHSNGSIDSSFANNGSMIYNFNGGSATANTIKLQADGKIILAGQATSGNLKGFAAIRLNSDGSLDTTFANGGSLITSISNVDDRVFTIALHPDGRIMLGGYSKSSTYTKLAVARYDINGNIDTSFNNTGIVLYAQTGNNVLCNGISIDSVGNYILSGNSSYTGSSSGFLRKYLANGILDTSFGINGTWTTGVGNGFSDNTTGIKTLPDGKMLVGYTSSYTAPKKFAIRRFLPSSWAVDPTFANGGTAYYSSGITSYAAATFAQQPDGKILVTGNYQNGSIKSFATVRYEANGALDSLFGTNGIVVSPFTSNDNSSSNDIAVQSNGGIIVAGNNTQNNVRRFALIKYHGSSITVNEFENKKNFFDLQVFPNPSNDFITVQSSGNLVTANITIINALGEIVFIKKNASEFESIDISGLAHGIYFLKMNNREMKFIKQ